MRIGNKHIGGDKPCFIVAEAGLAHGGSESAAFELVDAAAHAGADAVKFQIYETSEFISYERAPVTYASFRKRELAFKVFGELKDYARDKGLLFFATPDDISGLAYLKSLGVSLYKIGSGEKNSALFGKILDAGKATFISTGMREQSEILEMVALYGGRKTAFLHCVTMSPVYPHLANLGFLPRLIRACEAFGSLAGYSDHMPGILGVEVAVAMGAKIIEKHLKLGSSVGQDTLHALTGDEFKAMVKKVRKIEVVVGSDTRIYSSEERASEAWALKGADGKRPL